MATATPLALLTVTRITSFLMKLERRRTGFQRVGFATETERLQKNIEGFISRRNTNTVFINLVYVNC